MSDELKSAWELALEKLQAQDGEAPAALSQDQKTEIADIRRRYKAKIAEIEIASESSMRKAIETGDFESVEKIREGLVSDKGKLNQEMEAEIKKARETRASG